MANFVLVPGFWLGGWVWSEVAARLEAYGHGAFPVTLTGVGERAHLAGPQVSLATHIQDILNVITFNELDDVVLVGHSAAGMPVSMVADQAPERLSRVVYVESGPLPEGTSQADLDGNRDELLRRTETDPDGWRLPFPSWQELGGPDGRFVAGLDEPIRARIQRLATGHPVRGATDQVHYRVTDGPGPVPRALITCCFPANQVRSMLAEDAPMFAGFVGEPPEVLEVPTGHWPMLSEPAALTDALVAAARSDHARSDPERPVQSGGPVGFGELFAMVSSRTPERDWAFYRDVFDAQEVYRFPQDAPDRRTEYVSLRVGTSTFGIGRMPGADDAAAAPSDEPEADHQDGPRHSRIALWLSVTDCEAVTERARAAGAEIVAEPEDQPWGEKVAVVKDPDGLEIYLGQQA